MTCSSRIAVVCLLALWTSLPSGARAGQSADVVLPPGVSAVWDVRQAHRDTTATRERICINGLWRFQPAGADEEPVPPPGSGWGYFKVPGPWPADTNGDQTIYAAEGWQDRLRGLQAAWYEREIAVPEHWEGRRVGPPSTSTDSLGAYPLPASARKASNCVWASAWMSRSPAASISATILGTSTSGSDMPVINPSQYLSTMT